MKPSIALVATLLLILSSRSGGQQLPRKFLRSRRSNNGGSRLLPRGRRLSVRPRPSRGRYTLTPLFQPTAPSRTASAHQLPFSRAPGRRGIPIPSGKRSIVTAGIGWIQQEGADKRRIRARET